MLSQLKAARNAAFTSHLSGILRRLVINLPTLLLTQHETVLHKAVLFNNCVKQTHTSGVVCIVGVSVVQGHLKSSLALSICLS